MSDLSGPYRDTSGPTSVVCVKQAVEEFAAAANGFDIDVITADHQNKADIGVAIAREWIANQSVDRQPERGRHRRRAELSRRPRHIPDRARQGQGAFELGALSAALTGVQCSPNTVMWSSDTHLLAKSTGGTMVKSGGDTWFIITADYAFGHSLEEFTTAVVKKAAGKVLGALRYPFPDTTDFSSYLQQAQASGAKVLGLANAGSNAVDCIKQAHEFRLPQSGMRLAPLVLNMADIRSVGLETAQGFFGTETFYWDLNDRTRAFIHRVMSKTPNNWPGWTHAGAYAITLHYLKAVADLGPAEAKKSGAATVARMKKIPTEDDAFGKGSVREDGRGMFPAYLFEVKRPSESKSSWGLYKLAATTVTGAKPRAAWFRRADLCSG